jgi:transposase
LLRDNKRLTLRLQRAEAVIEIQKKVALLLGLPITSDEAS